MIKNNKIKLFGAVLASTFMILSCTSTKEVESTIVSTTQMSGVEYDYKEASVVWQQTAAEYTALCYQAFNTAKFRLNSEAIDKMLVEKLPAVVMDLDETVVDNSPYNGYLALRMSNYSKKSWQEWTAKAEAELIPGAKMFIDHVKELGIPIFYISNRRVEELDVTLQNLEKKGVGISPDRIMLRTDGSSKQERRGKVLSKYDVIMYVGDNLADFDDIFEQQLNISQRKEAVESLRAQFGKRFIILPNVMYGNWEKTLRIEDPSSIKQENREGNKRYISDF